MNHSNEFLEVSGTVDLLVVAGEASGDEHSARAVIDLKARNQNLKICALAGEKVRQAGADLLFPLANYGVVGLFEVLRNYNFFRDIFEKTVSWIAKFRPRCVLLVDYPGFNLRLARALKDRGISQKGGGDVVVLQYISPQLWAWKPKRRFSMAETLDGLGVIFPFETQYYEDVSLPVTFVGHPFADPSYISPVQFDPNGDLLLLPGSRIQPVGRILPVFFDALEELISQGFECSAVLPISDSKIRQLAEGLLAQRSKVSKIVRLVDRPNGLSARVALMSSGTMSLACAWSGIPGVIAYRAHPLTYIIGKMLVKVPYLGMANLLLTDDPPNPEYLQGQATGLRLAEEVKQILQEEEPGRRAAIAAGRLHNMLAQPHERSVVDWLVQEGKLG